MYGKFHHFWNGDQRPCKSYGLEEVDVKDYWCEAYLGLSRTLQTLGEYYVNRGIALRPLLPFPPPQWR
jgi:hypothetical protein